MNKLYDAICPHCGKLNRNLYLRETGGTMECESCMEVVKLTKKDILPHTTQHKAKPKWPLVAACF